MQLWRQMYVQYISKARFREVPSTAYIVIRFDIYEWLIELNLLSGVPRCAPIFEEDASYLFYEVSWHMIWNRLLHQCEHSRPGKMVNNLVLNLEDA